MRWTIFIIFAFIMLALDGGFMGVFTLPAVAGIGPNIVICLLVYICMFATRLAAMFAALTLGVMMDLMHPLSQGDVAPSVYVIGPHALGYVFAGLLLLQLRTMVFRQRAITIGALSFAATFAAGLVIIMVFVIRSWYGEPTEYFMHGSPARELMRQLGIGVYTALLGVPLGWVLLLTTPLWGFQPGHHRRALWR
ncbi:MAG TPA: hypothetical protein PK400_06530 [Phycisphaerales bacterium]|nr:hypothetical protein [Phycisphaerales bacterium]HRQ75643.1 hypothetical protein [Phycisphaerales bacterium]